MSWRQGSPPPTSTIPDVEGPPPPAGVPPTALPPAGPPPGGAPPPLAMWRKVVLGVIIVALVGGLIVMMVRRSSSSDGPAAAPAPISPPQTTAVTSPAQSDQPPTLVNTGDDWTTIMRSLETYFGWLVRHPDPRLLTNVMDPSNPVFADTSNADMKFAAGDWRYDPVPAPHSIESVTFVSSLFEGTKVLLLVRYGPTAESRIVDRAGNVVHDDPPTASSKGVLTLVRTKDDPHWRVGKADPS